MIERIARAIDFSRKLLLVVVGLAAVAGFNAPGQENPAPAVAALSATVPAKLIVFDVASIRLDKEDDRHFVPALPRDGDGVTLEYVPLELVIRFAYGIRLADTVVSGLPDWAKSDRYTIRAKVAGPDVGEWKAYPEQKKRRVLQQLLADRFKLQMHTEIHDGPIYELVVAPGGLKMTAVEPPANNRDGFMESYRPGIVKGHQVGMERFLQYLSGLGLGRKIQDKTGLTGNYDFTLGTAPIEPSVTSDAGETASLPGGIDPFLFTGLQKQLGLKLLPAKGPVESYVVDHVERPSEN